MPGAREWLGSLVLRSPVQLGSLRRVPVLGGMLHRLSHHVLPANEMAWGKIQSGPGEGLWLEVHPRTGAELLSGNLERPTQEIVASHLRPGMVFYDLGANIGRFSLIVGRAIGPQGKVFAFEPDPDLIARLRRNMERNQLANIEVLPMGVWSSSKTLEFRQAGPDSPEGGTGTFLNDDQAGERIQVRCISLDDFALTALPPQGIKCDVEGAEVEVLRGAEATLREHHPWILCELHAPENESIVRDYLTRLGYTCKEIDESHIFATA
jgi:FkbM family methyltransferase